MTIPSDTSPEIAQAQLDLLRAKSPRERAMLAVRLSSEVLRASKRAIRRIHPEWTAQQVGHLFIELHYGKQLADAVRQRAGAQNDEPSP